MILLGKRIKELRNKSKLTQTELAKQVGVTKSTITAYENDSRLPSYDVLIKMANVFKVSIDSLLIDHPGSILEVHGLNVEQMQILKSLIVYFRNSNMAEDFFTNSSPELRKNIEEFLDSKKDSI